MVYLKSNDPSQPQNSKAARAALSAYEEALFKKILKKEAPEKAQAQFANDKCTLSGLFSIFH